MVTDKEIVDYYDFSELDYKLYSKILGWLGVRSLSTSHVRAFIDQYYAWRDGIGVYGIFYAKK